MHSDLVGNKEWQSANSVSTAQHSTLKPQAANQPGPSIEQGRRECDSTSDRNSVGAEWCRMLPRCLQPAVTRTCGAEPRGSESLGRVASLCISLGPICDRSIFLRVFSVGPAALDKCHVHDGLGLSLTMKQSAGSNECQPFLE